MQDEPGSKAWLAIFWIRFEMRATDGEKRGIWKKFQEAKNKGEAIQNLENLKN